MLSSCEVPNCMCDCLCLENKLWGKPQGRELERGEHDLLGTMVDVFCWLDTVVVAGESGGTGVGAIPMLICSLADVEGFAGLPATQENI